MLIIFKNNGESLSISDEVSPVCVVTTGLTVDLLYAVTPEVSVIAGSTSSLALEEPVGSTGLTSNWSVNLRLVSLVDAQLKYIFTLTGNPDIEISISSFQARMRSGASTYLSVTIPGVQYASEITARSNGDLKIDACYAVGSTQVRQTIIWTHLDNIRVDNGAENKSISLSGYRQETYTQKEVSLSGYTYWRLSEGKYMYRFAKPNLSLTPGDTVIVDSVTFTADLITYYVSCSNDGKIETQMEVSE